MEIVIYIILGVMGAVFGSFACCQAWRLHERGKRKMPRRSECMKCHKKLPWYENIPVLSWVCLRGRCSGCGKKIGMAEILSEILMAAAFVGAFVGVVGVSGDFGALAWWKWLKLVSALALLVVLGVLAVYDGKWGKLPVGLLLGAIILGGLVLVFSMVGKINAGADMLPEVISAVTAVALTAGVYFVVSVVSRGKLCGDGDWLLGLAIGLALGSWWLALVCLAVSNLLAAVFGILARARKIYFGPFFVVGFALTFSLQEVLCLTMCLI